MFEVADKGFFINAPVKISSEYPEIPSYNSYDDLEIAFKENSHFIK
jgi:phosphoserine/homoserine phosphotransferase